MPKGVFGIFVPREGQRLDMSSFRGIGRDRERRNEHLALSGNVIDITEGATEGMFDRRNTRHADQSLISPDHIEGDGGDTGGLDLPCDQSHGPATIGSDRCEED
jgi:hypothetical protein